MSDRRKRQVGASPEVLEHHHKLYRQTCRADSPPIDMICACGIAVIVACTDCQTSQYLAVRPDVEPCRHADEVRAGLLPTGLWTEVDRAGRAVGLRWAR